MISLPPNLEQALAALAATLDETGVDWVVTGSTARALAGFAVVPRDLDVEVPAAAAARAARAVGLTCAEALDPGVTSLRAHGGWHGIELDVTGGPAYDGPGGHLPADFPLLHMFGRAAPVGGRTVRVAPVEEQIARAIVLGDERRIERIAGERPAGLALDGFYLSVRLAAARASR